MAILLWHLHVATFYAAEWVARLYVRSVLPDCDARLGSRLTPKNEVPY